MDLSISGRGARLAVSALAAICLAGCAASAGASLPAASAAPPIAAATSGPSEGPASAPAATPTPTDPARIWGLVLGGDRTGYSVRALPGWTGGEFIMRQSGYAVGLSVWDVSRVPLDPCHWKDTLRDPGPTVDDLVEALTKQATRRASEPETVTLAGYTGKRLLWSVPDDAVVTGDAEFEGCDLQGEHRDFVSWFASGDHERYQQGAGQVDHLWVLDVEGRRLVVDATYEPQVKEAAREQLLQLVESLRFEGLSK